MNGGNKTNLVQGKAERFKQKFDPDKDMPYRALLDWHKYTCLSDNIKFIKFEH